MPKSRSEINKQNYEKRKLKLSESENQSEIKTELSEPLMKKSEIQTTKSDDEEMVHLTVSELRELIHNNPPIMSENKTGQTLNKTKKHLNNTVSDTKTDNSTSFLWKMGQSLVLVAIPKVVPALISLVGQTLSRPTPQPSQIQTGSKPSNTGVNQPFVSGYY